MVLLLNHQQSNPQDKIIIKRVHQVLGNTISTYNLKENVLNKDEPCKGILET